MLAAEKGNTSDDAQLAVSLAAPESSASLVTLVTVRAGVPSCGCLGCERIATRSVAPRQVRCFTCRLKGQTGVRSGPITHQQACSQGNLVTASSVSMANTAPRSSNTPTLDSRSQLLQYLEDGSDVTLVFKDAEGMEEEVPGHALILKQWSEVLAGALGVENSSISNSSGSPDCSSKDSSTGSIRIPMLETDKEDWLLAMEFVYPVSFRPNLNWDKLEALLALGDKYGMPALIQKLSFAIMSNVGSMNLVSSSNAFVWKWILVSDKHGMYKTAQACIDSQPMPAALMEVRPRDALSQLSRTTLHHLVKAMRPWVVKPGQVYCTRCARVTAWDGYPSGTCSRCHGNPMHPQAS